MTISVGDTLPNVSLYHMTSEGPAEVSSAELFDNKRVVVFALPGAYTPTCSAAHLPGFVVKADEIKATGVDEIVCLSVNDAFVMDAWGKQQNAEHIHMIADGSADFTDAIGLTLDLTARGMGIRSQRYAMIVKNGIVEWLGVEEAGKFEVSTAESVLAQLESL